MTTSSLKTFISKTLPQRENDKSFVKVFYELPCLEGLCNLDKFDSNSLFLDDLIITQKHWASYFQSKPDVLYLRKVVLKSCSLTTQIQHGFERYSEQNWSVAKWLERITATDLYFVKNRICLEHDVFNVL